MPSNFRNIANWYQFPGKCWRWPQRRLLWLAAALAFGVSTSCRLTQESGTTPVTKQMSNREPNDAVSIHRGAIVIDLHADTTQRLVDEKLDLTQRLADGHFDSVRAREGGLDAQFFSIWVEPELFGHGGPGAIKRADDQIAAVRALAESHPELWQLATTAAQIRSVVNAGKMAALMENVITNSGCAICRRPGA
jgi:membrane dipeptidase (peptidase family M19)